MKKAFLVKFQQNRPCQGQDEWFDEIVLIHAFSATNAIDFVMAHYSDIRNVFNCTWEAF